MIDKTVYIDGKPLKDPVNVEIKPLIPVTDFNYRLISIPQYIRSIVVTFEDGHTEEYFPSQLGIDNGYTII